MKTDDVRRIAELARLQFNDAELEAFAAEFTRIVDYVGTITDLELKGVEPLSSVSGAHNVMRPDEVGECLPTDVALQNAPKKNEAFFKVPKVLG